MGKIILVGSRKGGVSKSTSIMLLADFLSSEPFSYKVAVCDFDDQLSIYKNYDSAEKNDFKPTWDLYDPYPDGIDKKRNATAKNLTALEQLKKQYDYVFVDVPGKLEKGDEHYKVMEVADIILVPTFPDDMSFNSMMSYLIVVNDISRNKSAKERDMKAFIYVSRFATRRTKSAQAKRQVVDLAKRYPHIDSLYYPLGDYEAISGVLPGENIHQLNNSYGSSVSKWAGEIERKIK